MTPTTGQATNGLGGSDCGESAPKSDVRQSNRSVSFFDVCISIRTYVNAPYSSKTRRSIQFVRGLSNDVE